MRLAKQILVWLSIFALTINLSLVGITSYLYQYQNDTFSAFFCENQDVPEKHCNGRCAMKKVLKNSTESSQESLLSYIPISVEFIASECSININGSNLFEVAVNDLQLLNVSFPERGITPPPPRA